MYRWLLSQPLWFPPQRQTTNDLEGAPFFAPFAKGRLLRSNGNQSPLFNCWRDYTFGLARQTGFQAHKSIAIRSAVSVFCKTSAGTLPTLFVNLLLEIARICSQRSTESFVNPPSPALISECVGYNCLLCSRPVMGTTITIGACSFNASLLTIRTGRVPLCSEPLPGSRFAR